MSVNKSWFSSTRRGGNFVCVRTGGVVGTYSFPSAKFSAPKNILRRLTSTRGAAPRALGTICLSLCWGVHVQCGVAAASSSKEVDAVVPWNQFHFASSIHPPYWEPIARREVACRTDKLQAGDTIVFLLASLCSIGTTLELYINLWKGLFVKITGTKRSFTWFLRRLKVILLILLQ